MIEKINNQPAEIELYVIEKAKQLRIEKGMTQADLAFSLDLTTGFIGKVESGLSHSKYNLKHINSMAKIFEVSPKDFLPLNSL